jgi:hypothetical protein
VVKILCGFSIAREPPLVWFVVYGTKGCLESPRHSYPWTPEKRRFRGYFEDVPNLHGMISYPLSVRYPRGAPETGNGTPEYHLVDGFINSILNDTKPPMDVYEAMDHTAPGICAHMSAEAGGKPIDVPNYRKLYGRTPKAMGTKVKSSTRAI